MKLNIKKLISLTLIFTMLISNPFQVLAQQIDFKPAITFEYEVYEPGKSEEYRQEFIAKLRANLDQDYEPITQANTNYRKEYVDNKGYVPTTLDYYNSFGTKEKVREAYNDFLYFNIHPEESPYYVETSLISGGNVTEDNILHILDRYEILTNDIRNLLKKNPAPERANMGKRVLMMPVIVLLVIIAFEGLAALDTAMLHIEAAEGIGINAAGKVQLSTLGKLEAFGVWVAFTIADIWISDYVAKESQNMDKRLGEYVETAGFYAIIRESVGSANLFRAAQQVGGADREAKQLLHDTRFYRYFKFWKSWFKREKLDQKIAEAKAIADFYDKGKIEYTPEFRKLIAGTLIMTYGKDQEGIPEINDYNKDVILKQIYRKNTYTMKLVRQELLRNYYALRFIRAELSDQNDPCRFDRAIIDLATTYKIMFVQKIDNRWIKKHDQSEQIPFADAFAKSRNIEYENFYQENPYYEEYEGIDYMAPRVMDNIPYQALEQRGYIDHELSNSREIFTDMGYDLFNGTSTADTYPTLLSRAQVNFLAQLIGINDREEEKRINDDISARVAARENSNNYKPDFSYLNTNLTEGQKRAVMSNCGTK